MRERLLMAMIEDDRIKDSFTDADAVLVKQVIDAVLPLIEQFIADARSEERQVERERWQHHLLARYNRWKDKPQDGDEPDWQSMATALMIAAVDIGDHAEEYPHPGVVRLLDALSGEHREAGQR